PDTPPTDIRTLPLHGALPICELQLGINHGRRIGSAFVNVDVGMQNGTGAFDAQGNHNPLPGVPDARYRKYTATVSYLQPFTLWGDRKSTRLNSSHVKISYAVF